MLAFGLAWVTWSSSAHAAMILDVADVGNDVIAIASGSVNTAGLSQAGSGGNNVGVQPNSGFFVIGGTTASGWDSITGPAGFGPSPVYTPASSVSGDTFGIFQFIGRLVLPINYVSGTPLFSAATFNNQSISSLGLTEGTYVYSWGSGVTADTLTINIPGIVPEPAGLSLLALSVVGMLRPRRGGPAAA